MCYNKPQKKGALFMQVKLFEILPDNFFHIFNSTLKETYADILYMLYFECEQENSYTLGKDELIARMEEYFNYHTNAKVTEEGIELKNTRDKANMIFRNLKNHGWIDTEFGVNGEQNVNFEDYAIAFLSTYSHFESESDITLSSYVYRIYQNIEHIDISRMYFVLKDSLNQAEDLIRKLRSLNANIKKYIKKIANFNEKSEEEQLNAILDQLLNDYKVTIIDNAYFYMKTHDNPIKYKTKFVENCKKIHHDENQASIVISQIMDDEKIDKETATEKFELVMDQLEAVFDKIIAIVDEIDRKNTKYISVAIEKIRILMNNNSDMEGQLLYILKNYRLWKDEDITLSFIDDRNIIKTSLYTPRKTVKVQSSPLKERGINRELENDRLMDYLKTAQQYSQKAIKQFIDHLLDENEQVTIHQFNMKEKSDLIRLILLFVYSENKGNNYKISWFDEETNIDHVHVPKFIIERKKKDE